MILDKWSKEIKGQKSKAKIEGMSNDSSCFRRVWKLLKSTTSPLVPLQRRRRSGERFLISFWNELRLTCKSNNIQPLMNGLQDV
jgi:hypothetical protein